MTRKYAEGTKVPVSKSRDDIEKILSKYGANKFLFFTEKGRAAICFAMNERNIKMELSIPIDNPKEERRLWRSLLMVIKAKLEAVESGVSVFDNEFMAHVVMPDGRTAAEHVNPAIESAYAGNTVPLLSGY